ncbi:MAG: hypothetical protein LBQ00_05680 [Syntrophobacterales bacterium]|jgi:hypothetical protein|nr:hypothetical protein [Syntrophobacterales bacterium]
MTVTDHQVGAVIKTYLKNKRDTITNVMPSSDDRGSADTLSVSDEGKKILFERMERRIAEKAHNGISST